MYSNWNGSRKTGETLGDLVRARGARSEFFSDFSRRRCSAIESGIHRAVSPLRVDSFSGKKDGAVYRLSQNLRRLEPTHLWITVGALQDR